MEYIIAMDVGGTTITSGVFSKNLRLVTPAITIPAMANDSAETVVSALISSAVKVWTQISDSEKTLLGIGIAFPGPFDYENGISLIQNQDKFQSIYKLPLGELLTDRLRKDMPEYLSPGFKIAFENDAAAYGAGAYASLKESPKRLMAVTIGTGCGSAFMQDGKAVMGELGIPEDGGIYHLPFDGKTIDDIISKRGIMSIAKETLQFVPESVKQIADLANQGDASCLEVFEKFGILLKTALAPFIESFQPDALVFGGNISKASELFLKPLKELTTGKACIHIMSDEEHTALLGGAFIIGHGS